MTEEVSEFGTTVMYEAPLRPETVNEFAVVVLYRAEEPRPAGFYIKGDDGEWYPAATFD